MRLDSPLDLLLLLQVVVLSMARAFGMAQFLPFMSKQQVSGLTRSAVSLAISLPAMAALWPSYAAAPPDLLSLALLAIKEVMLGALLGLLTAVPFWAVRGMGTLIDNQRGANAAQQANPALQADATLLGELSERALVALLVDLGVLQLAFTGLMASQAQWSVLDLFPTFDHDRQLAILRVVASCMAQALILAAPALLLLLLIELALAIASTAVQGFDVYASAMAIKTLSAVLLMALIASPLFDTIVTDTLNWWQSGLLDAVGLAAPR